MITEVTNTYKVEQGTRFKNLLANEIFEIVKFISTVIIQNERVVSYETRVHLKNLTTTGEATPLFSNIVELIDLGQVEILQ